MPKATAVWLVHNTSLTFEQIADFCHLHILEVQGIADGDVAKNILGSNPIQIGQLSKEEIIRCEKNPKAKLRLSEAALQVILTESKKHKKGSKYTPVARRQDKPNGIAWLLKHHPEMTDAQIAKLLGSTKTTVLAIRTKTHWNTANIRPKDPALLGLCSQTELNYYTQDKQDKHDNKDNNESNNQE